MTHLRIVLSALLAAASMAPIAADACGADSDCTIGTGTYRVAMPAGHGDGDMVGAIVYLHGYQSSGAQAMDFDALREVADRLGVALIAPDGRDGTWGLPDVFASRRDDVGFVTEAIDDAISRFPIDADRILVTGFSLGGSMAWYLACTQGTRYAGYAPIAGAFWEPYMADCATPLPEMRHVHGRADETVPMRGRKLSVATQGDVYRSFALLRTAAECSGDLANETIDGELACTTQTCGGAVQELCLHDGGHSVKPQWIERAWRTLAQARGWS